MQNMRTRFQYAEYALPTLLMDPLVLNSNTSEILTQYMPNTILNTSDTSDTSSIQKQYIQILPIHAEFTGSMYWMYFDVFDVNTSSKT